MKRIILIPVFILLITPYTFARNGLSLGLGVGMNPDPAGMQNLVEHDGIRGPDDAGITGYGIPSLSKVYESQALGYVKNINQNGVYTAVDLSAHLRWDFLSFLFLRTECSFTKGFEYEISWQYTGNSYGGTAPTLNSKQTQKYEYTSLAVPVTFGLNIPINKGDYDIYMGFGPSFIMGKMDIDLSVPQYAANAFVTAGGLTQYAFNTKLKSDYKGFGFNILLGADAKLTSNLYLFFEFMYQRIVILKDDKTTVTIDDSNLVGMMNVASTGSKVAIPIDLSSSVYRFGVRYYIF